MGCDKTSNSDIKCVCQKTGTGWDAGYHCSDGSNCKSGACGFVDGDSLQQCCKYYTQINKNMTKVCTPERSTTGRNDGVVCMHDSDCMSGVCASPPDGSGGGIAICCPRGDYINDRGAKMCTGLKDGELCTGDFQCESGMCAFPASAGGNRICSKKSK